MAGERFICFQQYGKVIKPGCARRAKGRADVVLKRQEGDHAAIIFTCDSNEQDIAFMA